MRQYNTWTPMRRRYGMETAETGIVPREGRVFTPDRREFGIVSTTVERIRQGTYHVQTLTYELDIEGGVRLSSQRVIDSGIEFDLQAARLRGERSHRQGMSELYVTAVQA